MIGKMRTILELRPNAKFTMVDDDITWLDTEQKEPTESEIEAKMKELEEAEPMNILRSVRNQILSESDWVVIKEREEGGSVSNFADWKTYRQALRDVTKTYKSLADVKWPTAPSE